MITFYPGPSKIYPETEHFVTEAFRSGILSMNHRSPAFMSMLGHTIDLLHLKLGIPVGYTICLVSSATECWEIIAQSLTDEQSLHLHNGAFGEKWCEYTQRLFDTVLSIPFGYDEWPASLPADKTSGVLCITHNETSNGTVIPDAALRKIRKQFKGLIAVDATSSLAGVNMEWELSDVWFASVQKCLGLPPGLGLLILSPDAVRKAGTLNERAHYNSLQFLLDNFSRNQTPYTPNTLGIYLLSKILEHIPSVSETSAALSERAEMLYSFFSDYPLLSPLVSDPEIRSPTVITLQGDKQAVARIKTEALKAGIILGNGYGKWKDITLRIANFPSITHEETAILKDFFRHFNEKS